MFFESNEFNFFQNDPTRIIAEIGVNHNGEIALAKSLVDQAKIAGADIVKFQAFVSEKEISRYANKTPYQIETTTDIGGQLEMCKALELSPSSLAEMKNYCESLEIPFLCAAFDFDSVDLLVDELKVSTIKIPSGEITNLPFLEYVGSKRKSIILSTGASSLAEVALAVEALQKAGCPELVLFHCVSSYPAPYPEVNLNAMETLRRAFNVPVGFSDHTVGIQAGIAASALGACAIEKHFTLDKKMVGPDHRASIEPLELAALVEGVKIVNQVKGDGAKQASQSEMENLLLIRKSIVAASDLKRGVKITREMVEFKRPGVGISPSDVSKIIGLKIMRDVKFDEALNWDDFR